MNDYGMALENVSHRDANASIPTFVKRC